MNRIAARVGLVFVVALLAAAGAAADVGVQPVSYKPATVKTALKAIGYPRAHLRKLTCKGLGQAVYGRYWSFRCVAHWGKHYRRVFDAAGAGYGGWLCVGETVAGCKVLRRGYLIEREGVEQAAVGFVQDRFGIATPQVWAGACPRPKGIAASVYVRCFETQNPPAPPLEVAIKLTHVRAGSTMVGSVLSGTG